MALTLLFPTFQQALAGMVDSIPAAARTLSQSAAPIALTAVWQGLAVAAGLAITLRLAPRISAAQRFAVWFAGFLALAAIPALPLLWHFVAPATTGVPAGEAAFMPRPSLQFDIRWSYAIAALWAAASAFRAADLLLHSFRLRTLWKNATPIDLPASHPASAAQSLRSISLRTPAQICSTHDLDRPSVIGFLAPRMLIPAWLLERLTPAELDQVVLHEAEHLRRGDDWTNLLQKLCLVLFPLNPALWWIEKRLCQEREMACDEGVVRVTRAPRAYAACLASLAERGLQRRAEALSLGAWQHRSELVHRVHSILARRQALGPTATGGLLAVLGCGLLFTSVELARCPQWVAFVPEPSTQAALTVQLPAAQTPSPQLLRAASTAKPAAFTTQRRAAQQRAESASIVPARWNASVSRNTAAAPRPVLLKAVMPRAQTGVADAPQYMIFTAWQQVEYSNAPARQFSDYDAGQGASESVSPVKPSTSGRLMEQFTVTRLIFRILPANPASSQPAAPSMRTGWLVLQL